MVMTTLRRSALAVLVLTMMGGFAAAKPTEEALAVRAVLDSQVGAWNEGDLDGFMDAYWNDEQVLGICDGADVKGWNALYEQYKMAYRGAGKEMGKLALNGVTVEVFGAGAAVASGKWELTTSKGTARGHFTQVLRKFPDGWKITHDHSSK